MPRVVAEQMSSAFANMHEQLLTDMVAYLQPHALTNIPAQQALTHLNNLTTNMNSFILNDLKYASSIDDFMLAYEGLLTEMPFIAQMDGQLLNSMLQFQESLVLAKAQYIGELAKVQMHGGILAGYSEKKMVENLLTNTVGLSKNQAKTEMSHQLNTFSATVTQQQAKNAPVYMTYYYEGPADERTRSECLDYLGAGDLTYKQIINQFGEDVWTIRGGYRCRHHWAPASSKAREIQRLETLAVNPDMPESLSFDEMLNRLGS